MIFRVDEGHIVRLPLEEPCDLHAARARTQDAHASCARALRGPGRSRDARSGLAFPLLFLDLGLHEGAAHEVDVLMIAERNDPRVVLALGTLGPRDNRAGAEHKTIVPMGMEKCELGATKKKKNEEKKS